jgi:phage I-like protein
MMAENVACQGQTPTLPEWIRVLPLGEVELVDNREPFKVDEKSLGTMVAAFQSRGVDMVIDYEHQSLQGERAPAAGWIKHLEAREDGLWARVEWTPQAREYLRTKEYRYFSPVLRLDPDTRKPIALMHLGLTNVPAIKHLPPLVAKWGGSPRSPQGKVAPPSVSDDERVMEARKEKVTMVQKLKLLMGLAPEAEEGAVWSKAMEVFRELSAALDLPGEASTSHLLGAVEALKVGAEQFQGVQEELHVLRTYLAEETTARVVEEAMKAGKVSPAQRDWAIAYHRRDPEGFQAYVARAPKVVPTGEELQILGEDRATGKDLLPEELALCGSLNISPEEYLKAKSQTG